MHWDKIHEMYKWLQKVQSRGPYLPAYAPRYQLLLECRLFSEDEGLVPTFRAALVRWVDNKREVLLESSNPAQVEAALLMLISSAEDEAKEYKSRSQRI